MTDQPRNPQSPMPPAVGLSDLLTRFGDIQVKDGQIVSPRGWESANCRSVANLPGLPGKRLYVNKAIEAPLREALRRCVELRDGYFVRSIACFAPRGKRLNPAHLSVHSWALAVDINPDTNPMRRPLTSDLPGGWVAAFEAVGFTWGGRFSTPDPMHFQWCSGY